MTRAIILGTGSCLPQRTLANADLERIVAVLHDVVEDSDLTLQDLRAEGFAEEALEAIDALTRRDSESKSLP